MHLFYKLCSSEKFCAFLRIRDVAIVVLHVCTSIFNDRFMPARTNMTFLH